ncbi:NAD-dependent epimerase/dehydratase family protein [Streptomyces griseorubiginosus]|uniref:NAD-dependent epimerase/dehydratase family protein n=1 Tax=Streptomyces griseorubiginosus TaxID=67304 RepID=UPI002E810C94|nr:NAD-dependent epimerase/dehydratase family protein [Streptomyces griseorubiginosus]WUB42907.1 NAD-dependent epimerase/dehydratase family protein [Streptomyces griseorubiginosus]WUB51426.1 NAD-dependent epimerase/dehydratase family protein [Streptomyces griseorubiginosus]
MRAVVTGAAGFIGSHLCAHLLSHGDEVVGVDSFTDFYDPARKRLNLDRLLGREGFRFRHGDLLDLPLRPLFGHTDAVYHLAGQPGVRGSWGPEFAVYLERNVLVTQRVLEAARDTRLRRLVFASSSSVYGDAEAYPTPETVRPRPVSPYGVTKLAAEQLCETYRSVFGVPAASLRLFSVYGPGQRPDMAFARLIEAARSHRPFPLYGDGGQSRDFTYVGDVVAAMRAAALSSWSGVANLGGGSEVTLRQVIDLLGGLAAPVRLVPGPARPGDARRTAADITLARDAFAYRPATDLRTGLTAMLRARPPEVTTAPAPPGSRR